MFFSRLATISLKNRSMGSFNILQRLGSCRRFQCRNYSNTPKYKKNIKDPNHLYQEKPLDYKSSPWAKFLVPAGILLVAGAGVYIRQNDELRAIPKGQGKECGRNNICGPKFGGPFALFDTEGHLVTERDLLGNWVLLYFGYTSSPDIGPEEVKKIAKVLNILVEEDSKENANSVPMFVTIDPQRDSSAQLRAYLKEFDHRIVGLTGGISAVREMAHAYRVYFKKIEDEGNDYLVDSSHKMYLLQPNMETVRCFGVEYNAELLAEEILKEMSKSSK